MKNKIVVLVFALLFVLTGCGIASPTPIPTPQPAVTTTAPVTKPSPVRTTPHTRSVPSSTPSIPEGATVISPVVIGNDCDNSEWYGKTKAGTPVQCDSTLHWKKL